MAGGEGGDAALFEGLQALVDSAFPKRCNTCGRIYQAPGDFALQTLAVGGRVGFKEAIEEDGSRVLELFRNCHCGSTLMDVFRERRDSSDKGVHRREQFGRLVVELQARGLSLQAARQELLKLMDGEHSEILEQLVGTRAR
jgi:hypothetical protein